LDDFVVYQPAAALKKGSKSTFDRFTLGGVARYRVLCREPLVIVSCQNACNDKNDQQALIKMHALGCENDRTRGGAAFNYL
jgi:hypothetical protein